MKKSSNSNINQISSKQLLIICNCLRSLGLKSGHKGTRLTNKAVHIIIMNGIELEKLNDIYKELSKYFPNSNPEYMRMHIAYAINNRDNNKTKENFKRIFGFDYSDDYFEPKIFIDELSNVIRIRTCNI